MIDTDKILSSGLVPDGLIRAGIRQRLAATPGAIRKVERRKASGAIDGSRGRAQEQPGGDRD